MDNYGGVGLSSRLEGRSTIGVYEQNTMNEHQAVPIYGLLELYYREATDQIKEARLSAPTST